MDEQIKPVACIDARALEAVGCGHESFLYPPDAADEGDVLLYDQQAIDTLRAEADGWKFQLDGLERLRLRDNAYLLDRAERAEAEAEALRAQLRGIQHDALELYEQIPQLPVTIHTLDAATDAFTRFCIDFSEHIDAARKGAE